MKQKQFAALALAAWLGVVGWVGTMILGKPQAFPPSYAETDNAMAAQIGLEIQQADALALALTALESPPRAVTGTAIIAVPPKAAPAVDPATGLAASGASSAATSLDAAPAAPRVVSMIISGVGLSPRAMIDGTLVGPGARLGDGAVVRRIEARAVHIRDEDGVMHRLALRLPGDPPPAPTPEGSP